MSQQPRIRVPDEDSRDFTEIAIGVRVASHLYSGTGSPTPTSNFSQAHRLYPYEPLAERAGGYVRAALEHLIMWADWVAPLKFHPDQETNFSLRPVYTLGRAGLESAAQAVWMLGTTEPLECIRRHICLMRWDLQEHRKSKLDQVDKDVVKEREIELLARVNGVFGEDEVKAPQGYLAVIRAACESQYLSLDPDDTERLWRAASGAAHGKFWPTVDLQRTALREDLDSSSPPSEILVPDTRAMVQLLTVAYRMTQHAALRYADYCGANLAELQQNATRAVAQELPLRDGVDPSWLENWRPTDPTK